MSDIAGAIRSVCHSIFGGYPPGVCGAAAGLGLGRGGRGLQLTVLRPPRALDVQRLVTTVAEVRRCPAGERVSGRRRSPACRAGWRRRRAGRRRGNASGLLGTIAPLIVLGVMSRVDLDRERRQLKQAGAQPEASRSAPVHRVESETGDRKNNHNDDNRCQHDGTLPQPPARAHANAIHRLMITTIPGMISLRVQLAISRTSYRSQPVQARSLAVKPHQPDDPAGVP